MPVVDTGRYKLNYIEQGSGFPIVLIHGLAGDYRAWIPQIEKFKSDYRVIAFDNPGSGGSSDVEAPTTMEEIAQAVLKLMDHLEVASAHVVGRSMGGAIAQYMALLEPARVASLTMAASLAKADPICIRILENMREVLEWRDNWTDWARHATWVFFSPVFYNANPEIVAKIEALIGDEARSKISYVNLSKSVLKHDTIDRLGEITCPVQIMAGGKDPVCSLTITKWMQDALPQAETVLFEDSSHFFLMEQADRAMAVLEDWFVRHTP
jgi:pimeloyl-ACP methyl ester carboxylesterase